MGRLWFEKCAIIAATPGLSKDSADIADIQPSQGNKTNFCETAPLIGYSQLASQVSVARKTGVTIGFISGLFQLYNFQPTSHHPFILHSVHGIGNILFLVFMKKSSTYLQDKIKYVEWKQ